MDTKKAIKKLKESINIKSLNNITEILEVDASPITVKTLNVDGFALKATRHFTAEVGFEPEEGFYTATGDFHLMVTAETREELDAAVTEALSFLWREYVMADPLVFSADALALRQQLTTLFGAGNGA